MTRKDLENECTKKGLEEFAYWLGGTLCGLVVDQSNHLTSAIYWMLLGPWTTR